MAKIMKASVAAHGIVFDDGLGARLCCRSDCVKEALYVVVEKKTFLLFFYCPECFADSAKERLAAAGGVL